MDRDYKFNRFVCGYLAFRPLESIPKASLS